LYFHFFITCLTDISAMVASIGVTVRAVRHSVSGITFTLQGVKLHFKIRDFPSICVGISKTV